MRALAVFHDKESRHWANLWLKPGFWHVFVCVCDGPEVRPAYPELRRNHWIRIDAQDGIPCVEGIEVSGDYNLADFYRREGLTVLELDTVGRRPLWPWMNANCVGMAKLVLGIRAPFVVTPWQLYNHLVRIQAIERAFDKMEAA